MKLISMQICRCADRDISIYVYRNISIYVYRNISISVDRDISICIDRDISICIDRDILMCRSRYIDASIELYRYRSIDMYQSSHFDVHRHKSIDLLVTYINMYRSTGYWGLFLVSCARRVRLITQLQLNYVVEIQWRYGSISHLRNYSYIFVEGSCFAETNISLGGVA
jgi:hypothetical protein